MKHPRASLPIGELLVHAVVNAPADTNSIGELADAMHLTARTLQRRCRDAQTTAKAAVDFVRCLQLVLDTSVSWDPGANLSIQVSDARTIRRILTRGALRTTTRPALETFLASQRLIENERVLGDVRDALGARLATAA